MYMSDQWTVRLSLSDARLQGGRLQKTVLFMLMVFHEVSILHSNRGFYLF